MERHLRKFIESVVLHGVTALESLASMHKGQRGPIAEPEHINVPEHFLVQKMNSGSIRTCYRVNISECLRMLRGTKCFAGTAVSGLVFVDRE